MSTTTHPAAALFPLLEGDKLEALVSSMRLHGYDPQKPVVRWRGKILDGRNRLAAAEIAGVSATYLDVPEDADPYLEAWKHNGARRDLEPSQRAAIYLKILDGSGTWKAEQEARRAAAKEARSKAANARRGEDGKLGAKSSASGAQRCAEQAPEQLELKPAAKRKAAAEIAAAAGVSTRTVESVQQVQRDAPEQFERVIRGEATAPEVQKLVKLERKAALAAELRAAPLPAPTGPFAVIVVDPPWRYDKRAEDITHRGRNPYPDMSLDEIERLPVATLAEPDALLWLWTTNAFIRAAYALVTAWGFEERTILTWAKDRMGTGDWLRGKTEHCILAVRGRPLVTLTNQTTLLEAPVREHSRKPDEFYRLVDVLCPGSKLEMFAREARPGWQAWGAEVGAFGG